MTELFREVNIGLGSLCFFLLCWRTPNIIAKLSSKRLYLSMAAFPILGVFASVWALHAHAPHGPFVPCFTLAYISLDSVLIRLPKGLRA